MKKIVSVLLMCCMLLPALPVFAASEAAQQTYSTETFEGEIIIPVTETTGTWKKSDAIPNYDGGGHIWSNTKGDTLLYKIEGISPGNYEVYNWLLPHKNNAKSIDFVITHNGKTSEAFVFQNLLHK